MKKAFEILKWLMLVSVIVLLKSFTFKQQEQVKCQQFDVLITASEEHFLNTEMIHNLLKNKNFDLNINLQFRRKIKEKIYQIISNLLAAGLSQ